MRLTDRVPEYDRIEIFRKKTKRHAHMDTKGYSVMGPMRTIMVVTHKATNALLTKIGLPWQIVGIIGHFRPNTGLSGPFGAISDQKQYERGAKVIF